MSAFHGASGPSFGNPAMLARGRPCVVGRGTALSPTHGGARSPGTAPGAAVGRDAWRTTTKRAVATTIRASRTDRLGAPMKHSLRKLAVPAAAVAVAAVATGGTAAGHGPAPASPSSVAHVEIVNTK